MEHELKLIRDIVQILIVDSSIRLPIIELLERLIHDCTGKDSQP